MLISAIDRDNNEIRPGDYFLYYSIYNDSYSFCQAQDSAQPFPDTVVVPTYFSFTAKDFTQNIIRLILSPAEDNKNTNIVTPTAVELTAELLKC